MNPLIRVGVAIVASFGAGVVGFLFVDTNVSSWYAGLAKPPLTPPDSVFVFVWLVLYALMAAAISIIWNKVPQTSYSEGCVRFYFVQLLFNAGWTMFFFGFHAVGVAFVDLLVLTLIVVSLAAGASEIDRRAAYLLAPYLAWLVFACYLNLGIWILN